MNKQHGNLLDKGLCKESLFTESCSWEKLPWTLDHYILFIKKHHVRATKLVMILRGIFMSTRGLEFKVLFSCLINQLWIQGKCSPPFSIDLNLSKSSVPRFCFLIFFPVHSEDTYLHEICTKKCIFRWTYQNFKQTTILVMTEKTSISGFTKFLMNFWTLVWVRYWDL